MRKTMTRAAAALAFTATCLTSVTADFTAVTSWLKLQAGRPQLGNMHGDIAVSSKGEVFVSVQDPAAPLQVYAPDGSFVRNVTTAPADMHGFIINREGENDVLYGVSLRGQYVVKMTLDGTVLMTIGSSSFPDALKVRNARSNQLALLLTSVTVADNGDLYVSDGYASDFVHRFDRDGKYVTSFGGKTAPYSFNTLHKLAVDRRFDPPRLIATDRANNRVVHLSMAGDFLGVVAKDLLLPAAVIIAGDRAIVGELNGRVSMLDKTGAVVERVGANTEPGVGTNKIPPDQWKPGLVLSPHGVAVNARGDVFISEFNAFGRVHKFDRR